MPVLIEDDGTVKVVSQPTEHVTTLTDFISELQSGASIVTSILPDNCRMMAVNQESSCYLIEAQPAVRQLTYEEARGRVNRDFTLLFPWTYFLISISNNPIAINNADWCFASKRITGKNSEIGFMSMPNTYRERGEEAGRICVGSVTIKGDQEVGFAANELIANLWASAFNSDLFDVDRSPMPLIVEARESEAYKKWRDLQVKDDTFLKRNLVENHRGDINYLLAWEFLTKNSEATDLLKKMEFPIKMKIQEFLQRYSQFNSLGW